MRRTVVALVFVAQVGCYVPGSLNPLHTTETVVAEPGLVGVWLDEDGSEVVVIAARRDSSSYRLANTDKYGNTTQWTAWVTSLGERRWLELQPENLPNSWPDEYRSAFLPLHYWFVLVEVGDELRLASLVWDSLQAEREEHPEALAHATVGEEVVITAGTEALRGFLVDFVERPGVLEEHDPLRRAGPRR